MEPAPKKSKKNSVMTNGGSDKHDDGGRASGMALLLGKRRCAAEANERIARVAHEMQVNSGNSSGNESAQVRDKNRNPGAWGG